MTAGVPNDKQLQHKTACLKCPEVTLPLVAPLSHMGSFFPSGEIPLVPPPYSPLPSHLCFSPALDLFGPPKYTGPPTPLTDPSSAMLAPADINSSEAHPPTPPPPGIYLGILSNLRLAVTATTCFILSSLCFKATSQYLCRAVGISNFNCWLTCLSPY